MRSFNNYSLRFKLSIIVAIASLLIMGLTAFVYFSTEKAGNLELFSSLQNILGYANRIEQQIAPLMRRQSTQSKQLNKILANILSNDFSISSTALFNVNNKLVGTYGKVLSNKITKKYHGESYQFNTDRNHLNVYYKLTAQEKPIGYIYFSSNIKNPEIIRNILEMFTLLFLLSIVIISIFFNNLFITPIKKLTTIIKAISNTKDYTIRAKITRRDEIGDLTEQFNGMVEKIEQYDFEQKRAQEQIRKLAYHDHLTNLPNRTLFKELLENAIKDAKRANMKLAIIYFDLDNFKLVNDKLGHDVGDTLLCDTVQKITKCLRENDTVMRYDTSTYRSEIFTRVGGDEFIIVLKNIQNKQDIATIAGRLIEATHTIVPTANESIIISASIGIAMYPDDSAMPDELIRKADIAMYQAKNSGKHQFQFYNLEMMGNSIERYNLEKDLTNVVINKELVLFYQPKLNAKTKKINGVEALLRWKHPKYGLLTPNKFINIAENTGLISNIDEWVISTACAQCRKWHDAGLASLSVSVNLSPRKFTDANFITIVKNALKNAQLPARFLEMELNEQMVLINNAETMQTLQALKKLGVILVLDDFGSGYSSLKHLSQIPIDTLKIDQAFINENKAKDFYIAKAIIDLAHNLQFSVTAEGVETDAQYSELIKYHCDDVQGFLFSKPKTADEITQLLLNKIGEENEE